MRNVQDLLNYAQELKDTIGADAPVAFNVIDETDINDINELYEINTSLTDDDKKSIIKYVDDNSIFDFNSIADYIENYFCQKTTLLDDILSLLKLEGINATKKDVKLASVNSESLDGMTDNEIFNMSNTEFFYDEFTIKVLDKHFNVSYKNESLEEGLRLYPEQETK